MEQHTERTSLVLSDALSILQGMIRALDAHERSLRLSGEVDAPHRMAAVSEVRREMAAAAASARDVLAHLPSGERRPSRDDSRPPARLDRRAVERRSAESRVASERRRAERRQSADRREAPAVLMLPSRDQPGRD